ncbi:AraC family transcriptional regulator [Nocardioides sp.]|uniref:AraC family transcriptional regulator n=1 Tax=Nocardioides sp. TaxID=35761 RepID=UPI003783E354
MSSRLSRLGFINVDRTRLPVRRRIRSRGVPNALQDHPVACTADVAEATEVASQLLGDLLIEPHPDGVDEFLATMNAVRLVDVTLAYLDLVCPSTVRVPRSADCFSVHMTTAGRGVVTVGGDRTDLSPFHALVVSPGTSYVLDLERDSPQLIVRIERAALERQLTRMLGRSLDKPVQFEPLGDLTADGAVRWHGALQILSSEIVSPESLIHQGVGADSLEELIISTLLHVQPSTYSERLHAGPRSTGRPAVRRSMDYIEQHLAEPITMADLAAAAGMSTRSIQAGFREDLETTPIAFIRDRRLDRVRHTLMEAAPGEGMTVTAAAERWGFTHLGSFSVLYRRRFGESPSETLRR